MDSGVTLARPPAQKSALVSRQGCETARLSGAVPGPTRPEGRRAKTLNRIPIRKNKIIVVLLRFNDLNKSIVILLARTKHVLLCNCADKILHWDGLKRCMFLLSWTVCPKRRKPASFCPEPPQDRQSITDTFSLVFFTILNLIHFLQQKRVSAAY